MNNTKNTRGTKSYRKFVYLMVVLVIVLFVVLEGNEFIHNYLAQHYFQVKRQ